MMSAVGFLGGLVALLALTMLLLRLLLVAGLAGGGAWVVTTLLWAEAGPILAIATGGLTFVGLVVASGSSALSRWM